MNVIWGGQDNREEKYDTGGILACSLRTYKKNSQYYL